MKLKYYFMSVASALMLSNCAQEETPQSSQGNVKALTATIEGSSRSAVTDGGVFSWTEGDAISVWNGESFTEFTRSNGNVFTTSEEAINPSGVAIYPANDEHGYDNSTVTVNLATEYDYGSTNAPMVAEIESTALAFKHVGGLMRFIVKGMPETANSFTFTANAGITGDFTVNEGVITVAEATESNKSVTINFTQEQYNVESMTFYVPLPTGTYEGYTVTVGDESNTTDAAVVNTIGRGTLLLMPTFTFKEGELTKSGDNLIVFTGGEEAKLSVKNGEEVTVNVAEGAIATLSLTAPEGSTEPLTVSDGSADDATSNETATGTLNVSANAPILNISTPTLTVNLTGDEYDKVSALTAQQTLIIGNDMTIGELVLNGGNVKLEGNLTIKKPLEVHQDLVLDLNGYTLTTADPTTDWSAAVIVYKGNVTIKNGTIATNGTEAHKLMGAVWVRGTEEANVTIENGTFKGNSWDTSATYTDNCMATVYVSNENGFVTINGGDFYCVQQAQVDGQNHILNYKNSFTTKNIVVNGGTFHGMNPAKGNGEEVTYVAEQAIVAETEAGVFEVLSAKNGVISLAKDMTIVSPLVFNGGDYTFDLGGMTLSTIEANGDNWSSAIIVYKGNVTIKNGTIATNGTDAHKLMGAVWVRGEEAAKVTIEEGVILKGNAWDIEATYTDNCMATVYVSNPNGYAVINGGDFYCVQQAQVEGQNHILNYKNSFTTKNIVVNGGTFHGMNPAKGNGEEVTYVAEQAIVAETEAGVFEVLSAKDGVISLAKDMTIVSPLVFNGGDYTFDLGGKTLSTNEANGDNWSSAIIVYKGNVTIKNGTIATNGTDAHKLMGAVWVRGTEDANVTIENGTFKGNSWNTSATYTDNCMATIYVSNEKGFVTINGGDFYCVQQAQVEGQNHILNYKNSFTTKNIVVNGGTFYGMNPAKGNGSEVSYLADGYQSTESSENVYTVTKEESNN